MFSKTFDKFNSIVTGREFILSFQDSFLYTGVTYANLKLRREIRWTY